MTTVDARTAGLPGQGARVRPALFIDAGVGHFRFQGLDERGQALFDVTLPSNSNLVQLAADYRLRERFGSGPDAAIFITGKLATLVKAALGGGKTILPAAAAWMAGRERRAQVSIRADRCGVFSSSATISDKNQGIPLPVALATTLKSEILKACRKLPSGFDQVCLGGRVFHWRFARDCAEDYLRGLGVREVLHDPDNDGALEDMRGLVAELGVTGLAQPDARLLRQPVQDVYPAFAGLKARYAADQRFLRQPDLVMPPSIISVLPDRPLHLALDVGSTMDKASSSQFGIGLKYGGI